MEQILFLKEGVKKKMITSSFTQISFGPGGRNSGLVHGTLIQDRNGHTHYDMIQKKIKTLLVFPIFDRSNTDPTNDFDGRQAVEKELEVMREVLKHPNVLPITEIGYLQGDDTRVYTYSPRCNAGDLGQVFNSLEKPDWFHDEFSRRRLMLGAWRGLRFLHDIKYLHYDLKPHNIFLHSQGHGKPPHAIIGDVNTILHRKICVDQLQKHTYPIGTPLWGTPFIKCDPQIDIVPLAICTFLCVWEANPNVSTKIARQAIIDTVIDRSDNYDALRIQYIARYWGWIPMPDQWTTRTDGTPLTDTIDTAVYTEFSNVLAHIDDKIGRYKPWELIMALTNKEFMTSVWPELCDPFISWLHVSLTTGDTTMTTTRTGGDEDMYFTPS